MNIGIKYVLFTSSSSISVVLLAEFDESITGTALSTSTGPPSSLVRKLTE